MTTLTQRSQIITMVSEATLGPCLLRGTGSAVCPSTPKGFPQNRAKTGGEDRRCRAAKSWTYTVTQPDPLGFLLSSAGAAFGQFAYRLPTSLPKRKGLLLFS
ncbi:MAG: hypothetical protein GZ093_19180 [Rhodoferax sp.]|uniref:hypothetical protein n=1 Tax=Rhodoferax sp. TaxID=50421 RepID=UPI0014005716|nr:hypothetical protein [Rhodoferax sp.]NDP40821.1 hypothetical protein [Rhodoferax sp.]